MSNFFDEIAARLSTLTGSATPKDSLEQLNEFDVRDIQAVRVSEGGGGGGSQPWDEHDLSTLEADWTDDGVGTWTFVDGVISQTDATANSGILCTSDPQPSIEYVIQADIRIPTGQDSGTTAVAVIAAGNINTIANFVTGISVLVGEGSALQAPGSGDGGPLEFITYVDGTQGDPVVTAIGQDEWCVVRAVVSPSRQVVYLNGDYVFSSESVTGGNDYSSPSFSADLVGLAATGLVDFRNVKVWTRTLPA